MSDNMCEHGGLDGNCLRCKDATITRLQKTLDSAWSFRDAAIRAQKVLEAENAALREEVENEKRQTAEVERWSGLLLYSFCVSGTIAERAEKELERDRLALSDENARLNEALGEAEAKVEKVRKTINDPMVCEYQQMRNRLIEDLK